MRILLLVYSAETMDGWGRYARTLQAALRMQDCEVEVAGGILATARDLHSPLRDLFRVRRVISSYKPDIIHVISEPYIFLIPLLPLKGIPVFNTVHGTFSYSPSLIPRRFRPISRYLYIEAMKKVSHTMAVSAFTKDFFLQQAKED